MESARASTPQGHTSKEAWGSSAKVFYGPEEVVSQHTLSGEAAEDVGDVVQIDIAPNGVSVTSLRTYGRMRGSSRRSCSARARCRLRVGEPNGGRRRRQDRSASSTRSSGGLG